MENLEQVSLGATVDVIDAENVVSVLQQVGDSNMRGHSRRACNCEFGVFHTSKCAFKAGACWIAAAGVVEHYWVSGCGLRKGRTQVDGWGNTSKNLVGLVASVNESRGDTPKNLRKSYHLHLCVLFVELEVVGLLFEKGNFLGVACVPLRRGMGGFSGRGGD